MFRKYIKTPKRVLAGLENNTRTWFVYMTFQSRDVTARP